MLTDHDALRQVLNDEPVTGEAGWSAGLNVEGLLRWVTADLDRCPSIVVGAAVFDHYGSGYASYVEIFLTKPDGAARRQVEGMTGLPPEPLVVQRRRGPGDGDPPSV